MEKECMYFHKPKQHTQADSDMLMTSQQGLILELHMSHYNIWEMRALDIFYPKSLNTIKALKINSEQDNLGINIELALKL